MSPILSNPRTRRIAVAVALGGGLALGVAGLAQAADPAPSGSAAPGATAPSAGAGGPSAGRGAPHEHGPRLFGTVTAITGTRITITDRDGFTRQINITAKPDGVAVGTRIHAEGAVNADGVSLDATSVVVAPDFAGKRGGGPGHHGGSGWPGGPRGGSPEAPGTPPSGAPSAPAPPVTPSAPAPPVTPSAPAPPVTPSTPPSAAPSAPAPSAS